jgi:hypothetical protein
MAVPAPRSASCQTTSMSETWQEMVTRLRRGSAWPSVRTVATPAHHSGNRLGSNSSFQTSSTGGAGVSAQPEARHCSSRPAAGIATEGWWRVQLDLCTIGMMAVFGWEKALGDDDELGWWADRVEAAAHRRRR